MINPKKYAFDRYCPSHCSFLCFPIAAVCIGSLLPSPPFPVSSDENPALVNPHLCFRPPLFFPFFSCSYNLIYYFVERHVFFSSFFFSTITMYVILVNAFKEFYTGEYIIKFFLLSCILLSLIFLTIKYEGTTIFLKYVASFLNSSTEPICLCARGQNKYSCSTCLFFSYYPCISISFTSPYLFSSLSFYPHAKLPYFEVTAVAATVRI